MGVWPLIYTALLVVDGQEQRFPAWPFAAFSFAVGAFALLPYFILRQPAPIFSGELNRGYAFGNHGSLPLSLIYWLWAFLAMAWSAAIGQTFGSSGKPAALFM